MHPRRAIEVNLATIVPGEKVKQVARIGRVGHLVPKAEQNRPYVAAIAG